MYETLTCCQGTIPSNSICFNLFIKNLKKSLEEISQCLYKILSVTALNAYVVIFVNISTCHKTRYKNLKSFVIAKIILLGK